MLHIVLIALHATAAVTAFGLGCSLVAAPPASGTSRRFTAYRVAAWSAVLALITVVAVDFAGLPTLKRLVFSGLVALAAYLLVRTELAARTLRVAGAAARIRFLNDIGFVLISLFDGFCIVGAIDLRMPPTVVALVAVAGVAAGILTIRLAVRRENHRTTSLTTIAPKGL